MANSEKIFGCCNVFSLAKGLTITEIVLVVLTLILGFIGGSIGLDFRTLGILIHFAYVVTEYIGIHKKNKCLIIFGCVYRVLEQILVVIFIVYLFINSDICQGDNDCETFL